MVAKRFSSTTDKKERGKEREREREKKADADSERKTQGAKRGGEADKAKGPREHVCFPKDRSLGAASTK